MNDPDAQGAGPEPAQNAVPPQQPPQPPNPFFMQPPPGIGGESNYRAFYTDQSKDPHQGAYKVIMAEFNVPLGQAPPQCSPLSSSLLESTSQVIKASTCPLSCIAVRQIPQMQPRDM